MMNTDALRVRGWCAVGLVVCMAITGCASTSLLHDPGRLIGRPKAEKNVARILAIWEPAEGTGVDGKPARGFAGQVLFFGPGSEAARKIDGAVTIVEYDHFSADDEDPQPLHSFQFQPDAWNVHGSDGALGYSYSVFIPYMQKHKDHVTCGLQVEYTGDDGRKLSSGITPVILKGKHPESTAAAELTRRGFVHNTTIGSDAIQPTGNEIVPRTPAEERRKQALDTMTISLQGIR